MGQTGEGELRVMRGKRGRTRKGVKQKFFVFLFKFKPVFYDIFQFIFLSKLVALFLFLFTFRVVAILFHCCCSCTIACDK